jgi:hypothetical protein
MADHNRRSPLEFQIAVTAGATLLGAGMGFAGWFLVTFHPHVTADWLYTWTAVLAFVGGGALLGLGAGIVAWLRGRVP